MAIERKEGNTLAGCQLQSRLWKGTFAETWKASLEDGSGLRCLQFFDDQDFLRLAEEYPITTQLTTYSHVASLLSWDADEKVAFWNFFPGRRLYTFINELKSIKTNIAVFIIRKVLEILTQASAEGVVHGGLRPTRIIITPNKRVKITSLGLGHIEQRLVAEKYQEGELPENLQAIVSYFPSEVVEDQIFDDIKNDIYAVGVMLCEMLTGQRGQAQDIPRILHASGIQKRLSAIILKAVADFESRYHHPEEMYQDLTRLIKPDANTSERIRVPPPTSEASKHPALEAVPADSEEYRIANAEHLSAKQAIDESEVIAEPADSGEYRNLTKGMSEEEAKREIKKILRKTRRLDVDSVITITDINNQILDPLEKEAIWPRLFLRYSFTLLVVLGTIFVLATFGEKNPKTASISWVLSPIITLEKWPTTIANIAHVGIGLLTLAMLTIPFWDRKGQFVLNSFFTPFLVTLFFGVIGLGLWHQAEADGGWFGLNGKWICAITLAVGIIISCVLPSLASSLRKQMAIGNTQRVKRRQLKKMLKT